VVFNKGVVFRTNRVRDALKHFIVNVDGLDMQVEDFLALPFARLHGVDCVHVWLGVGDFERTASFFFDYSIIRPCCRYTLVYHFFQIHACYHPFL